ncbi:MAG: MFS transporter [Desulfobacteraceae bacterium]|nr:MFS transporter [Desulfobacteraceae bacterium]
MIVSMMFGYMPWYNFSALIKYIADEYRLTAGDTGEILAAFQLGYVLVVGATGWLADKISLKKILFWATLLTGIFATCFVWGANSKTSIMVLRLLTGLSAGAIYVPGMALLARWFPPEERGKALGAYTGALVAAYAGGYLVSSWLAAYYNWRIGILFTSLPAFAAAGIIHFFVSDKDIDGTVITTGDGMKADGPGPATQPAPEGGYTGAALITTGYTGHMWELYAFWGWVGPFLVASAMASGMSGPEAVSWGGTIAAAIILLGLPSSWIWGSAADRLGRTWAIIVAGSLSVMAEFFLGYLYGHGLAVIVITAGWIGFWVIADSAVFKAGLTEMVHPRLHGFTLGIQSVAGFGATIVSPVVFGKIIEHYNGPVAPTGVTVWGPGFLVLGLGGLLAPVAAIVLRRHGQSRLMAGGKR